MEQAQFANLFAIRRITVAKRHYTDCRSGCLSHFFARLHTGRGAIVTAEGRLELAPGDVFYIPKGLAYQSYWSEGTSWDSYRFDFYPARDGRQYVLQKIACTPDEIALIDKIAAIGTETVMAVGLLYTLFGRLQERMTCTVPPARNVLLQRALSLMEQHPDASVPAIADGCGISVSGLYGLFRRLLGRTPTEEKHRLLCERAVALLSTTDLRVEEISDRLGFSSSSYFRKILFSQTGKTPSQIRKTAGHI